MQVEEEEENCEKIAKPNRKRYIPPPEPEPKPRKRFINKLPKNEVFQYEEGTMETTCTCKECGPETCVNQFNQQPELFDYYVGCEFGYDERMLDKKRFMRDQMYSKCFNMVLEKYKPDFGREAGFYIANERLVRFDNCYAKVGSKLLVNCENCPLPVQYKKITREKSRKTMKSFMFMRRPTVYLEDEVQMLIRKYDGKSMFDQEKLAILVENVIWKQCNEMNHKAGVRMRAMGSDNAPIITTWLTEEEIQDLRDILLPQLINKTVEILKGSKKDHFIDD